MAISTIRHQRCRTQSEVKFKHRVGISFSGLAPPLFCSCPKPRSGFPTSYLVVFFHISLFFVCILFSLSLQHESYIMFCYCVQWVEVKGDCWFCWYWWNWWSLLFKLSFHNPNTNRYDKGLKSNIVLNVLLRIDLGYLSRYNFQQHISFLHIRNDRTNKFWFHKFTNSVKKFWKKSTFKWFKWCLQCVTFFSIL